MRFKIGDKVRIIKFPEASCVGYICEVIEDDVGDFDYCCRVKQISTNWECLMLPNEIKKEATKGRQLLFSFMEL